MMVPPSTSTDNVVCCATGDVFLEHDLPTHPERADRLRAVHAGLELRGLSRRMRFLEPTQAPTRWITRVHDPEYVGRLERQSFGPARYIERDTYLGASSYRVAMHAVGAAIACLQAILEGNAQAGMALVRPPGHHARRDGPMGFCLLNNIACAAAYAVEEAGIDRVLILDFDAHHGNGTQEAFWEDPGVLYVSMHQSPLYPGTGSRLDRGAGAGEGYTVNLPIPPFSGDASYDYLLSEVVVPLADDFHPEVVMLSAGFDAHWRDSLAGLSASLAGLTRVTEGALAIAERHCAGRLLAVLEGGYDHEVLATGVSNLAEVLLGTPERCLDPLGPPPQPPADDFVRLEELRETFLP